MPRRGDNIRKRKDGRWEARYPKDDQGDFPKRYGSVYGRTYQEAKEKRDQIVKERPQPKGTSGGIVFKDILDVAFVNITKLLKLLSFPMKLPTVRVVIGQLVQMESLYLEQMVILQSS